MKKFFIIFALLVVSFLVVGYYWQVPFGGTYLQMRKLAVSPTTTTPANKGEIFFKYRSAGDTATIRRYADGSEVRLDSVGNERQDTTFYRVGVVSRGSITATDSLREVIVPAGATWRIDTVKQWATNPSSLTYNLYRNTAGTVVAIFSSNVSITSSVTNATGLQNTTITGLAQIWLSVKGGTADNARVEIIFKNQ